MPVNVLHNLRKAMTALEAAEAHLLLAHRAFARGSKEDAKLFAYEAEIDSTKGGLSEALRDQERAAIQRLQDNGNG